MGGGCVISRHSTRHGATANPTLTVHLVSIQPGWHTFVVPVEENIEQQPVKLLLNSKTTPHHYSLRLLLLPGRELLPFWCWKMEFNSRPLCHICLCMHKRELSTTPLEGSTPLPFPWIIMRHTEGLCRSWSRRGDANKDNHSRPSECLFLTNSVISIPEGVRFFCARWLCHGASRPLLRHARAQS